jgi:hypothetical protein
MNEQWLCHKEFESLERYATKESQHESLTPILRPA